MKVKGHFTNLFYIRNIAAEQLFEIFFVSAITSVLVTRSYLALLDYPQISTKIFHIAHMLWGGLFMLLAFLILLALLSSTSKYVAAILGGIGFGLFIDELGKFITSDNNYFFQPTVALIYIIFVLLFLLFQSIEKYSKYTKQEYLINAIEMLKDVVLEDLDKQEKQTAMQYLRHSDHTNTIVIALKTFLSGLNAHPVSKPNLFVVIRTTIAQNYRYLISKKWFVSIIIIFFTFQAIASLTHTAVITYFSFADIGEQLNTGFALLSLPQQAQLISTTASAIFIILGITKIHRSRLGAYYEFKRALLISIFITQFFSFYQTQFFALTGLVGNILLLVGVEYMISQEQRAEEVIEN